jgi:hypothetical protein
MALCPKCKKQELRPEEALCPHCKSKKGKFWANVGLGVATVAVAVIGVALKVKKRPGA